MTDLRTAAQQALEALVLMRDKYEEYACPACDHADAAIYALRTALEQPEQEPVAWMYVGLTLNNDMHGPHLVWKPEYMDAMSAEKGVVASPLFTHPPRREWRGLTDEGLAELARQEELLLICDDFDALREIARAVEAALKERNA